MNFAQLTQIALLGVEHQSLHAPQGGHPLGDLLVQLNLAQRESAFLSAAALMACHRLAGTLPLRDTLPCPEPCAAEEHPRVSVQAGALLHRLLEGEHTHLMAEWLSLAAGTNQLAPPESLPALLSLGASQPEVHEPILRVLGRRGLWLAAQNSDWSWVAGVGTDEAVWHTGGPPARRLFLRQLRRSQPARALELLAATWKEETPDDRAAFIAELETGLSPGDEDFLEAALDDKRKEVRRAAAFLLARLPASAFVSRMIERAQPLLKFTPAEPGKFLKLKAAKKPSLEITLPAGCDRAMLRDGVEPKPPKGFGEKIWWLTQMLETVPIMHWVQLWHTTPVDILAASRQGEWKKELFAAWTRAAVRQQNAAWAGPLFEAALEAKCFDKLADLLRPMPTDQVEMRIAELLRNKDKEIHELQGTLVTQCRHAWGADFSRSVLAWLRKQTAQPCTDWQLRNQLPSLASRLAPSTLAEAGTGWPTDVEDWVFWSKGMDEFLSVLQFRSDLQAAFR